MEKALRIRGKKIVYFGWYCIVIYFLINLVFFQKVDAAEPFGTSLGNFNGIIAYSNCSTSCTACNNNCSSYNYANDGKYLGIKWQCVEFVRRYYYLIYGLDLASSYRGDAKYWYDNASTMGLDKYPNGSSKAPQIGDILVSNGDQYGHIAIIKSVSNNQVCTIQQNFSNNTNDVNRCLSLTISNGSYTVGGFSGSYPIQGWLRSHSLTPTDKSLIQMTGDTKVYWLQNNKIYHIINETVLNTMQNAAIPGWSWSNISTVPSLSSYAIGPDFISTSSTSNGLYIRLYGGADVYLINNGKKIYVSYTECQQVSCWGDIIDVPQTYLDMFPDAKIIGYASVSQGVTITPSLVVLGQDFTVSFTLKEIQGASIAFEKVAIAILRSDNSLLFDLEIYNNVTIPANGTWSQSPTRQIFSTNPPGNYKAVIRGKVADGDWFDFSVTDSGVNPKIFTVSQSATGTLSITTTPVSGEIYVDASSKGTGSWSGSVSTGSHTVSFGQVSGYTTPSQQTVTVNANQTTSVTGTYTLIQQTGTLSITTTPVSGEIYVDGSSKGTDSWSGSVSTGSHTVSFGQVSGYTTPSQQTVTVNADQTTSVTGTYTPQITSGSIKVNIIPQEAVNAGAQWKLTTESTWYESGYVKSELAFGTYQVEFKPIDAWNTPAGKEVTISAASPGKWIESDPYTRQSQGNITIKGTVVNLEGAGVPGAKVEAVAQDNKGKSKLFSSAVTDSQGKFTLYMEAEGTFYLVASKDGFGNSLLESYTTSETWAMLTLTVLVNSSETLIENKSLTLIQIFDHGILTAPPFITLLKGHGTLSNPIRNSEASLWEIRYTPGDLDKDSDKIGIKIEPKGEDEGFDMNYFFTIHPTLSFIPYSKKVQTTFENAAVVFGQAVGKVVKEDGQIIDDDDQTTFMIDPDKLTTPFGAKRTIEITRTEVENSSAKDAIQNLGVTSISAVYDFAFIDPSTGDERGDEIKQITLKIKVNSSFDINRWAAMISHDPSGQNPDWHFTQALAGTVIFDGQYLIFDLAELYGQGVVITSSPAQPSTNGGGNGGGGGGCFISVTWKLKKNY